MAILLTIPAILSFLVLAAHFLRGGNYALVLVSLLCPFLLTIPGRWPVRVVQFLLIPAFLIWLSTAFDVAEARRQEGRDAGRAMVILVSVGGFALLSAGLLEPYARRRLPTP